MRRTRLSQGYEMAFVSPLAPVTKFPTSFLPCSVQRAKQTRRARHIIVPTAGYERDSYGRSAVTQPKKSSVSYRPPMRSRKGQTSFKNTVRFPPGKLPFSLEIDFVLNHPITDAIIAALVALNCLIFPLQTIDVGPALHKAFVAYEHNLTIVFLIEYFGRWYGKALCLRYLLTRGMIIDFLAVAPFAFDVADQSEALFVRLLRLSRILRIQRVFMDTDRSADLTGSMTAIQVTLANIGLSLFNLLYVSAGLFYIAEKDVNPNVLNFFDAFYYSTITLFTVGFGDVTPLTSWGRTITVLTVLTGAILVPFQLSRLEQVRLFTEGNANGSDDEVQDDVLGLDLIPLTGTTTTTLTDKTIKGHQTDARFCRNCGSTLTRSRN